MLKKLLRFLLTAALSVALTVGVYVLVDGMYLLGLPQAEAVQSVQIAYTDAAPQTYTAPEQLTRTLSLTNFLKYDLFGTADASDAPLVTLAWTLTSGKTVSLSASRTTVWWQGKAHALKHPDMFMNLTEGIFPTETN